MMIIECTKEQIEHLDAINRRLRELEEKLYNDMLEIGRHLKKAIADGMDVYSTFVIDGQVLITPDMDAVPKEVQERFEAVTGYTVDMYPEKLSEADFCRGYEVCSQFDRHYFQHKEDYPAAYFPKCRTFHYLIEWNLELGNFSIDDLMQIQPDNLYSYIEICL